MMAHSSRFVWTLLLLQLLVSHSTGEITQLTSQEFYQRAFVDGTVDVIVDVRRQDEWDLGHIEGALFLENFNTVGDPNDLAGCEYCEIIVYCRSGTRAGVALNILQAAGFKNLYNGLGVTPWLGAEYELVNTTSTSPECTTDPDKSAMCQATFEANEMPLGDVDGLSGDVDGLYGDAEDSGATGMSLVTGVVLALSLSVVL